MNNLLYQDRLVPDLIVDALSKNDEHPCIYLGGEIATYREVRHKVSQYAQALQQKNIKAGTRVALLSGNCPDVVFFNLAASIVGCCVTPLHPLGSFEDQAYILNDAEIEVSLFIDPNLDSVKKSKELGATSIELHTGPYAISYESNNYQNEFKKLVDAASLAKDLSLKVNAGHGLNYKNLQQILRLPYLNELNIGHAIIAESVFIGLDDAIKKIKRIIDDSD